MMSFNKSESLRKLGQAIKEKLNSNKKTVILGLGALIAVTSLTSLTLKNEAHGSDINQLSGTFQAMETEDYSSAIVKEGLRLMESNESELKKLGQIQKDVDSMLKVKLKGYAVNVDGKNLAIFKTKAQAEKLLNEIMKPYKENDESEIVSIEFKENVKIELVETGIDTYDNFEDAFYFITKGTNEIKTHKVEKGEYYGLIAEKYNIRVKALEDANPNVDPEKLQIGQEISLVVPKPYITVVTKENAEYEEKIEFETKYEETSVLFKGEFKVKNKGKEGIREIKAKIVKENGIEIDREIIKATIMKEPVTEVVLKGTKNPPPKIGTGTFAKPTSRGTLTSRFGSRWGRRHEGIDIGMPVGTDVKAADGGKVIYSGYRGDYGYLIIIDHGANMQSYYAHNSKLLVSKGDKVYKGQHIAESGNTGRSTGPHLHLEIRKNGTPVNPLNYVKY